MHQQRTTNIVIAALGGEGGGTLAHWIEEVAYLNNWQVQTTSVAGVAQRTGATIYYVELCVANEDPEKIPVLSMFPSPGDVDIAISSEISEAGRLIQRGFCTRERTTLVSSSHHVHGITEKISLGDGTVDTVALTRVAQQQCKRLVCFDLREIAEKHNTVISATLFGALAGAKVLPFPKESFLQILKQAGKGIENNVAAFNASYNRALAPALTVDKATPVATKTVDKATPVATKSVSDLPLLDDEKLVNRVKRDFPQATHYFLILGVNRLLEYQDARYAHSYLEEMDNILLLDDEQREYALTRECARYLSLWMTYEDTARVAQIKTRKERLDKIRAEVKAQSHQVIHITEYFAPRLEELCQPLPANLARKILASPLMHKVTKPLTRGMKIRTDTIMSYLVLRMMAFSRRWRRITYTFAEEHRLIQLWLNQIRSHAPVRYPFALELAQCARIIKGYGRTRERTSQQIEQILQLVADHGKDLHTEQLVQLCDAAQADDDGTAFTQAIQSLLES